MQIGYSLMSQDKVDTFQMSDVRKRQATRASIGRQLRKDMDSGTGGDVPDTFLDLLARAERERQASRGPGKKD